MQTFKLEVNQNAGTQFFQKNENVLLKEFAEKSMAAFREAGALFSSDSETNIDVDGHSKKQLFDTKMEELQNVFQNLCVIKKKNSVKSQIRANLATQFYNKNLLKRVFQSYKGHWQEDKYLRAMGEYSDVWNRRSTAKRVLKSWLKLTMVENRVSVKNGCLKKTDLELQKMQKEYENLISNLESVLSKKLLQLKREEEEHRGLSEKYDAMVEKRQN